MTKRTLNINSYKLHFIQIAIFYDDDKSVDKNNDFYQKSAILGLEQGNETILPTKNLPSNIPYIQWKNENMSLQISKERADLIYSDLYRLNHDNIASFKSDLTSIIESFVSIFYNQDFNVYRMGLVVDFACFTSDEGEFANEIKLLRPIYANSKSLKTKSITGIQNQIVTKSNIEGKAYTEINQLTTLQKISGKALINGNTITLDPDEGTISNGIVLRKDYGFTANSDKTISKPEIIELFQIALKNVNRTKIYNDILE
jgi:hypothetical protein